MKRTCIFITLLSLLLASAGLGLAQEPTSIARGDTLIIYLEPSDSGDGLDPSQINWPKKMDDFIDLVNYGNGEFFVEVSNDSTRWKWVENTLKKNPAAAGINFPRMNRASDGGINVARMENAVRILSWCGLTRKAVRYIPIYDQGSCFIKIYPVINYVPESAPVFISAGADTMVNVYLDIANGQFSLGAGLEWVAVKNGEPIMVPAFTAEYRQNSWLFAGTAGLGNFGDGQFGSQYQRLFAASTAWLPKGSGLGLVAKFVYASQGVDSANEYLQQGYGPYLGLAYRGEHLAFHLAGGVSYFDRYQTDRHSELSATAGCRYNFNF